MFFDRISRSFELARSSWRVLLTDKQLVIFPMLSGACFLLILTSFAVPAFVYHDQLQELGQAMGEGKSPPAWIYLATFAFYFCTSFVMVFFNSALVSCALIRFNGGEPTLGDGLRAAASRLPQIAAWALVAATVGLVLKIVESSHEKVGHIISALLGTAWSVVTFFVVPVLVVEKVGPFQAIGRSLAILRRTWGEALVGSWGLGIFKFLLALPGVALLVLGLLCLAGGLWPVGVALLVVFGLYLVLWMAVGSALDGIYLSALYQYAVHGDVPNGFDADNMRMAFARK